MASAGLNAQNLMQRGIHSFKMPDRSVMRHKTSIVLKFFNMNQKAKFCLSMVLIFITHSCNTDFYPTEKLKIDSSFLQLFNSVSEKDTFTFENSIGSKKVFLITRIDSILRNKKGWFTNSAPYKELWLSFKEIGYDTTLLERPNMLLVHKNPTTNTNSIVIAFNNLHYSSNKLPVINHDTITANMGKINDYYFFETKLWSEDSRSIKELYMSPQKGFIGFNTMAGEVWLRED